MADEVEIEDKQQLINGIQRVLLHAQTDVQTYDSVQVAEKIADWLDEVARFPLLPELQRLRLHHEKCTSEGWVTAEVRDSLVQQNNALSRRLRRLKESVMKEIMFEERGD